jgi:uncharacterized membrane protein
MAESRPAPTRERVRLITKFRLLDQAAQRKLVRFASIGIVVILIGTGLFAVGMLVGNNPLLIGFGVIMVVIGIINLLIAFINPSSPDDLKVYEEPSPVEELHEELFADRE